MITDNRSDGRTILTDEVWLVSPIGKQIDIQLTWVNGFLIHYSQLLSVLIESQITDDKDSAVYKENRRLSFCLAIVSDLA